MVVVVGGGGGGGMGAYACVSILTGGFVDCNEILDILRTRIVCFSNKFIKPILMLYFVIVLYTLM